MKKRSWSHNELGHLRKRPKVDEYDTTDWVGVLELPAFAKFRYRGARPFRGSERVPLTFRSHEGEFVPTEHLIQLAVRIVKNQEKLATGIKQAFFDDLTGVGPPSGMWWYDDADARRYCEEVLAKKIERKTLQAAEDFDVLLGEPSITIWDDGGKDAEARIDFGSPFEIEHGVEALTDGVNILGLGYQGEASHYRRPDG